MFDMINNGGHGNDNAIGMKEGTQDEAYDIDGQPFFHVASANCTTFSVDGQGEDESEDEEEDNADPDGDVLATAMGIDPAAKKKISKRIAGHTPKEDICLCRSWLAIAKTPFPALRNGKALATVDIEDEGGDKATLPCRPRGHKSMASDMKKDAVTFTLSETFKGWMADKEEAIAMREEKKRREKEANCNQFFDLRKKAIEVKESMAKTKSIEAEAKLMAEEKGIMLVDTTNTTEGQMAWMEKRRAIILQHNA
jgi:hypothetical protein